jgi:hypothetical protein
MTTTVDELGPSGLLLSPVIIAVEELIRTTADSGYVENEADPVADAASHLQAVAVVRR